MLEVKNLSKYYFKRIGFLGKKETIKAVDNVSFEIEKGESVGLVGETGCGKSTLARCILRIEKPTAGEIIFDRKNVFKMKGKEILEYCRSVQIVFQNPYTSLDPRLTIKESLLEPLTIHFKEEKRNLMNRIYELLKIVGLEDSVLNRYPHELSGGQNQRVAIARAISLNPKLLVLDEPTSSLDVSVQAMILNLLKEIQEKLNLSYLFISHDLSVIKYITNKVIVMYSGKFVEKGYTERVLDKPYHPYTKMLLEALPIPEPKNRRSRPINSLHINGLGECVFYSRCPYKSEVCEKRTPNLVEVEEEHFVACHSI
ncbi:MAG: ABC transporter ATP-binding protein [Nitrososphaeria archaeon]|nr:ABC transporter ATP-binding protein [Nitrososphaeria archaeon]